MRSIPANTLSILQNAPENGISESDFVFIQTVDAEEFGFYSDIDPSVSVGVIDGLTGNVVTRTYEGAGTLQKVGDITLSVGLNVYTLNIDLSNIHPSVQNMVRGSNVRNARIEIHRGIRDPITKRLADAPLLYFMGTINKAEPRRGSVGNGGVIRISATSATNELTRTNPAKFSDATIRRRNNDRLFRYADIMGDVRIPWGAESSGPAKSPRNFQDFLNEFKNFGKSQK